MVTDKSERGLTAAARALLVLVRAPRAMASSAEIAGELGTHPVVIRRLLGRLRGTGLVESRSGREGGWAIAKDPATIRISDIHDALTGERATPETALEEVIAKADAAYVEALEQVTLADLARGAHPLRAHS